MSQASPSQPTDFTVSSPPENPGLPPLPAATPSWMRAKQQRSQKVPGLPPLLPVTTDASQEVPKTILDRIRHALSMSRDLFHTFLASYGLSFGLHAVILIVLSLIFFSTQLPKEGMSLFGGDGTEFSDGLDLDTKLAAIEDSPAASIDTGPIDDAIASTPLGFDPFGPAPSGNSTTGDNGAGGGGGDGDGVAMPSVGIPGFAVTKGSFSVWTEPKTPKPRENYYIFIHVKLPKDQTIYPSRDLTGEVIGTDGYRLVIQNALKQADTPARIQVRNGGVQLKVFVPGADRLVKDQIRVNSRLLRENQNLEIQFQ